MYGYNTCAALNFATDGINPPLQWPGIHSLWADSVSDSPSFCNSRCLPNQGDVFIMSYKDVGKPYHR